MSLYVMPECCLVDERMSFSSVGNRFHTYTGCSDRERVVAESPIRPWDNETATAGSAQRRARWHVGDRCEQVGNVVWCITD